jgi:glycine hydroxymethyltransferase
MGLGMSDGGHRTHGYYTATKKMAATSIYFETLAYSVNPVTQLIDYDNLRSLARIYKPQLILCGACAYTRDWDYEILRDICDEAGAWLLADIAHAGGLIIAGEMLSPFEHCDVVTTTT